MASTHETHLAPTVVEAEERVKPFAGHDSDSWSDTFLIAGLVVALGFLVFVLTA